MPLPRKNLCGVCGGKRKKGKTIAHYKRSERAIIILDVPATVCENCGEEWLANVTVKQIDKILNKIGNDKNYMNPFNAKEPILIKYKHPFDAFLTTVIIPNLQTKE